MNPSPTKLPTYSVIIRTLGKGGEKYAQLIQSIRDQKLQPLEVMVFIPEGYDLPESKLGWEQFIRSPKGMMTQRVYGVEYADKNSTADYFLLLDDDISFEPDFAQNAMDFLSQSEPDMLAPASIKEDGSYFINNIFSAFNIVSSLLARKYETRKEGWRNRVSKAGGYLHNSAVTQPVLTETGNGQCSFLKKGVATPCCLSDELWIDASGYPLPEDQIFFNKIFRNGYKMIYHPGIKYRHLDNGSNSPQRKIKNAYAHGRNFLIFWHRFLYNEAPKGWKRWWLKRRIGHRLWANYFYFMVRTILPGGKGLLKSYRNGWKDAKAYIAGDEYKNLRPIILNQQIQTQKENK